MPDPQQQPEAVVVVTEPLEEFISPEKEDHGVIPVPHDASTAYTAWSPGGKEVADAQRPFHGRSSGFSKAWSIEKAGIYSFVPIPFSLFPKIHGIRPRRPCGMPARPRRGTGPPAVTLRARHPRRALPRSSHTRASWYGSRSSSPVSSVLLKSGPRPPHCSTCLLVGCLPEATPAEVRATRM